MKAIIEFQCRLKEIDLSILNNEIVDIDFNGELMVQFAVYPDIGKLVAVNAVNGGGHNVREEYFGDHATIFIEQSDQQIIELFNPNTPQQ